MKLPNDVFRCHNGTCPFRENCLRWILREDYGRIVSAYIVPSADGCRYMIRKPELSEPININLIQK